jgi:hypothetical protein
MAATAAQAETVIDDPCRVSDLVMISRICQHRNRELNAFAIRPCARVSNHTWIFGGVAPSACVARLSPVEIATTTSGIRAKALITSFRNAMLSFHLNLTVPTAT